MLQEAALEWFVRLRDAELEAQERRAFDDWLQADPRHAAAYREAEALWAARDQVEPDATVVPLPIRAAGPTRSGSGRRWRRLAQVAAVLAIALSLGAYTFGQPAPLSGLLADYHTVAGARQSVQLADGSGVDLNGAASLSVDFEPDRRAVTLHSGAAFFQVAKDAARPFVVHTDLGRIEVLGTAFAVQAGADYVEVAVTESRVAITHANGEQAVLHAGEGLRLGREHLGAVEPRDAGQALAWRSGKLVFRNTPLAEVINALERQRPGRIALMDTALRDLKVTGSFNQDDGSGLAADKALDAIADAFPVRLLRLTDYVVLIFPQDRD
ncbi:MAG: FecR domain-containing protein [Kiloniellaceae bacterium]